MRSMAWCWCFILAGLILLLHSFALAGGQTPEQVIEAFFNAVTTRDYSQAEDYLTREGRTNIDMEGLRETFLSKKKKPYKFVKASHAEDMSVGGKKIVWVALVYDKDEAQQYALSTLFLMHKEQGAWKIRPWSQRKGVYK
jgi:hypothetical protein